MSTPSEDLASRILKRLIDEKLFAPSDESKLQPKLITGKLTVEDWRLAIELAQGKGKRS